MSIRARERISKHFLVPYNCTQTDRHSDARTLTPPTVTQRATFPYLGTGLSRPSSAPGRSGSKYKLLMADNSFNGALGAAVRPLGSPAACLHARARARTRSARVIFAVLAEPLSHASATAARSLPTHLVRCHYGAAYAADTAHPQGASMRYCTRDAELRDVLKKHTAACHLACSSLMAVPLPYAEPALTAADHQLPTSGG